MGFLNQIIERVALIQANIPGITEAFAYLPANPTALSTPFFINEVVATGNPASIAASMGQQELDFKINMILCYGPVQSDYSLQLVEQNTLTWPDVVFSTFAAKTHLSNLSGVLDLSFVHDAFIMDWGGPAEYTISDTSWSALRFTLRARLFYPQTVGI